MKQNKGTLLGTLLIGGALIATWGPTPAWASGDCCKPMAAPKADAPRSEPIEPAQLTAQGGRSVSLPDGRPWVLTFFYGNCKDVCPTMIYNVAEVALEMPEDKRARVAFGAITFDPARDTVPKLAEYFENFELKGDNTYLMTGEPATLERLVKAFKFDYKSDRKGGFQHTTLTAVMDGKGRIVQHFYGLRPDTARIARVAGDLLEKP